MQLEIWIYTLVSVVIVSLVAVFAAIPLLIKKKISQSVLLFLMSISVGTLLGGVFIHFLPEAVSHGYTLGLALNVIYGFLAFFIIEKLIHHHHNHSKIPHGQREAHSHACSIAPINIIGDGVHNFIDGLVLAGSYAVSIPLGIAATISVVLHEVPQEIADFGILLYAGMSKAKALLFNFYAAITAILGAVIGLVLTDVLEGFNAFIIPFTAGVFLYIAAANLVPELHHHCKPRDAIIHVLAIALGVAIMVAITLIGPGHAHG